ncbi:MAG: response regulator [Thermoleophilia bacterium]|nr:response regulator [Thermoleophilia bacterium]MDH3725087.1 response regulator [Thermoleophilia bacterium]
MSIAMNMGATQSGRDVQGRRVLVIEDDRVSGAITAAALRSHGAVVDVVRTGSAALERLARSSIAAVVCDVGLPDMGGVRVAREFREACPGIAIVMLTGDTTFETAVEAIRAGADDYLSKPVAPRRLLDVVAAALKRRENLAARETVLAVGAHPDDVEIGCGGLLLAHAASGDKITVLTLSQGARGGEPSLRGRESRLAAEMLGADLVLCDLEDTAMEAGQATIDPIADAIATTGATIVYTHTNQDVHQDHRAVHRATLVAAREVSRVFAYQAPSTSVEFAPTRFMDIEQYLDAKIALIDCYSTQADRPYLEHDLLRATARYWARFARNTRYVEPLEVLREATSRPASLAGQGDLVRA